MLYKLNSEGKYWMYKERLKRSIVRIVKETMNRPDGEPLTSHAMQVAHHVPILCTDLSSNAYYRTPHLYSTTASARFSTTSSTSHSPSSSTHRSTRYSSPPYRSLPPRRHQQASTTNPSRMC